MKERVLNRLFTIVLPICLLTWGGMRTNAVGADMVRYSLSDVDVLYVFDDPKSVDWPTLYYLNDTYGCRVDLLTFDERPGYSSTQASVPDREIYLHTFHLPPDDTTAVTRMVNELFRDRMPQLVFFEDEQQGYYDTAEEEITARATGSHRIFNIRKIYRKWPAAANRPEAPGTVVLNGRELYDRYHDRMSLEIPVLLPHLSIDNIDPERLTHYDLVMNLTGNIKGSFLAGIQNFRLTAIIDSLFQTGPMKETLLLQAKKFSSFFNASRISVGRNRVKLIVDGYRELTYLNSQDKAFAGMTEFQWYLEDMERRAERAALHAVGIGWDGKIILRDSPHGPKLKFLASISVDGPKEVQINSFTFDPFWDTTEVVLDSVPVTIVPHQSYIREFLVDVDHARLEGKTSDSLSFTVRVAYGGRIPLTFKSKLPLWEAPKLSIKFDPSFYFVKPFPELDVDKVVSSTSVRVDVIKPYDFAGTAEFNLSTPKGMFAGAYRKNINLEKGFTEQSIRIPFSISNLFELGTQPLGIDLIIDGKTVASDTGHIRIAACRIPDTRTIGFLPDTVGLLEDVLRMCDASFQPLTDRSLLTADLDAYSVIAVGSGALRG
ncbi:MAG TPA: hypothetical protein VJ983_09765, partial [candidate division Zixibacteria bacterium]|nr:hypothetical protein [candidate division Zixibacteria bacterium]